ncbi:MAG: hypothetical protein KC425_01035 [Anaerolineales bacterium]|nr:hypothetical protein [Anaerolineales bacterium]
MSKQAAYADYLPAIKARWQARQASWAARRQQAWGAARQIAALLRARYGAEQVIAFGSLTHDGPFDAHSDIDLAVTGIPTADFFRAYAEAMSLAGEFKLDLLDLADCPPSVQTAVLKQGIPL